MGESFHIAENSLGDDSFQFGDAIINDDTFVSILQSFGVYYESFAAILQTIVDGPNESFSAILQTIDETAYSEGFAVIAQRLSDIVSQYVSVTRSVYLDGRKINSMITGMSFKYDRNSIHNTITIDSISKELYELSDTSVRRGEVRIEVHITENSVTRILYFLLEERSGGLKAFSLWGRDQTARDSAPYVSKTEVEVTEPVLASTLVDSLLTYSTINWLVPDFTVYDFDFQGYPLDAIKHLTDQIGAVIRATDDGVLEVRSYDPERPAYIDNETPGVSWDDSDVIVSDRNIIYGNGANKITVIGRKPEMWEPELSVEESSPVYKQWVHIRAYWAGIVPTTISTSVTSGQITLIGTVTENVTQKVVFVDGEASVSYPIKELISGTWIGKDGGTVTAETWSKTLTADNTADGIATIVYTTEYQRYVVSHHYISDILAIFTFSDAAGIELVVETSDTEEVDIGIVTANLLSNYTAAKFRATTEIDKQRYDRMIINLTCPYQSAVIDGVIAGMDHPDVGKKGNYSITSVESVFERVKTINKITVERCLR